MHQELYKGISINQYSCIKFLVNKIVRKYHIFSSICFLWPEGIAIKKYDWKHEKIMTFCLNKANTKIPTIYCPVENESFYSLFLNKDDQVVCS